VVYFAATGSGPFGTGHPAVMMYRIVHTEPDLERLPPRLRELAAACLAKDPARRPGPAQLADALAGVVPPGHSPAAFWPAPVARLVRDYQAGPGAGPPVSDSPVSDSPAPAPPTLTPSMTGREAVPGMGRRRALAALAGMAAGGLAVAGWELARRQTPGVPGNLADQHGAARALPAAGRKVWSFEANSSVQALTAARGVVYVGTGQDTVFALDAATGKPIWRRATVIGENSQLVVADGALVIADPVTGGVLALDTATGQQLWHITSTGSGGVLGLAAAGDVAYAGYAAFTDTTGGVTALSARTGDLLWAAQFAANTDTNAGLTATDGTVFATTSNGEIYAFGATKGKKLWRDSGRKVTFLGTPLVVSGGVLYAASDNSSTTPIPVLYAIHAASGRGIWQRSLRASDNPTFLAVADGVLFLGDTANGQGSGYLSARNAATGEQLWEVQPPGGVFPVAATAGNVVYSGSNQGVLDAWQANTGSHLWAYSGSAAPIASNIVVSGGIVYFGSNDHHAYAVAASS
jgi:outer membrane protein assembly factor BamB